VNPVVLAIIAIYDARVAHAREQRERGFVGNMEFRSGVERSIISNWRLRKNSGHIDSVTAVANTLGYRLVLQNIATGEIVAGEAA